VDIVVRDGCGDFDTIGVGTHTGSEVPLRSFAARSLPCIRVSWRGRGDSGRAHLDHVGSQDQSWGWLFRHIWSLLRLGAPVATLGHRGGGGIGAVGGAGLRVLETVRKRELAGKCRSRHVGGMRVQSEPAGRTAEAKYCLTTRRAVGRTWVSTCTPG